MLRIILFGISAILFGFTHALPATSDTTAVIKRGKYGYTPKVHITCPSNLINAPFYIQESFASNYARLGRIPAFDPDASTILFDVANQDDGVSEMSPFRRTALMFFRYRPSSHSSKMQTIYASSA